MGISLKKIESKSVFVWFFQVLWEQIWYSQIFPICHQFSPILWGKIMGNFKHTWEQASCKIVKVSIRWASILSAAALSTIIHSSCSAFSATSRAVKPKWSRMVIEAPPSTRIDKFEAWPCSAATCKAVRPSPRGPIQASKSAPACARIRRHRDPGLVAAACKAVRPHESLESKHLISSPLSKSSKSSALSHNAAWCNNLKFLKKALSSWPRDFD